MCSNRTHAISIRYDLLTQHTELQYTRTDNKINDVPVYLVSVSIYTTLVSLSSYSQHTEIKVKEVTVSLHLLATSLNDSRYCPMHCNFGTT